MAAEYTPRAARGQSNHGARTIEMSETVLHLVEHFGYAVIGLLILAEGLGVPMPGEASLVIGAALAATTGRLSIAGVIAAAAAGAIAGAAGGYGIGASVSDARLHRWAARVGLGPERFQRAQEVFRAHGARTAVFGRFITLFRVLVAVLAGASRMPFGTFMLFSSLGAVLWALTYGMLGYVFGANLPLLERVLGRTSLIVLLLVVLAAALLYLARRRATPPAAR
jgi:membrane protein DedA with SNARE-associated domain